MKNPKILKFVAVASVLFVIMAILPVHALAPSDETIGIPAGAMTFDELRSIISQSTNKDTVENDIEYEVCVETADAWQLPPEIVEKMTKEDLNKLACLPGYFTPNQMSIEVITDNIGGQMLLDETTHVVKTIVIIDEEAYYYYVCNEPWFATWEGCCAWANNILEGGDDYLEIPFGIDFQAQSQYYCYWETPDYMDYYDLLDEIDGVDPTGVSCDVIVLMTGQSGGSIVGLANRMGHHFLMNAAASGWPYYIPVANLFQHEASHLYDCSDHGYDQTYCIMSYTYQWQTRGYCTGCTTQINLNCARFD